MLERLRKALFSGKPSPAEASAPVPPAGGLAGWAQRRGLRYTPAEGSKNFSIEGTMEGVDWRLERGNPSRDFIHGSELRGRQSLKLHQDVAVLIVNRQLKDALEQRAYAQFTDTLQTAADARMPEEVRWLSMYEEVGIAAAPIGFDDMYAVLADTKPHANAWISEQLATELMRWPGAVGAQTPIVLMAFRGNVYLRMEFAKEDIAVLEHAALVYATACTLAAQTLPKSAV